MALLEDELIKAEHILMSVDCGVGLVPRLERGVTGMRSIRCIAEESRSKQRSKGTTITFVYEAGLHTPWSGLFVYSTLSSELTG